MLDKLLILRALRERTLRGRIARLSAAQAALLDRQTELVTQKSELKASRAELFGESTLLESDDFRTLRNEVAKLYRKELVVADSVRAVGDQIDGHATEKSNASRALARVLISQEKLKHLKEFGRESK